MVEWLAFGECCDNHSNKGNHEETSYNLQAYFVCALPHMTYKSFEELGNGELGDPYAIVVSSAQDFER